MKKILYLLLFIPLFCMQSCVEDEKDIFDASAAERIAAALKEYKSTLTAASNGWLLEYYPEKEHAIGGFSMICQFYADNRVAVCSEVATTNTSPGDVVESEFQLISDKGPVLSFNTYNEIMHYFSEPRGSSDVDGMAGDYEFIFMNVTPDKIILQGKKWGNKLVMTRLGADVNYKAYFQDIANMEANSTFGNYVLNVNGKEVGTVSLNERTFKVKYQQQNENGETGTVNEVCAFIYTPEGLTLYEPFTCNGVTMEHFTWNKTDRVFTCSDPGVNAEFKVFFPEDFELFYENFLGTWTLTFGSNQFSGVQTRNIEITTGKFNKTLIMSGDIFPHPLTLAYNAEKGTILLTGQTVGTYAQYSVEVWAWDANEGYIVNSAKIGMNGIWDKNTTHIGINFVDNKVWVSYKVSGLIYYLVDSASKRYNYPVSAGKATTYYDLSMKKQ